METTGSKGKTASRFGAESLLRLSRVMFLIALSLLLGIIAPGFWRLTNAFNVLRQASLLAVLAIGQTVIILTGGIDLSMGTVATLAAIATTWLLDRNIPMPVAVLGGTTIGALAGMVNGVLRAYVGLPTFVATYGTMWVAIGFAVVILGGYNIYGFEPAFRFLGIGRVLGIPVPLIVLALLTLLMWFILQRTTFGRRLYATGANPQAARLSGIDIKKVQMQAHIVAGLFAGFTGVMLAALLNSSEAGMADQMLLPAIAAVVVGGASLRGGQGSIIGTLIGALIMMLVVNGMNLLGISSNWQGPVQGFVILLAVLVDQWGRRAFGQE
jgi:ribose transport system permease protein